MPNDRIEEDVIRFIPIWLESKFDNTLQGADIIMKLVPKFLDSDRKEDIEKAEEIIIHITDIKAEYRNKKSQQELLEDDIEYKMVLDEYWVREFFNKYIETIVYKCSDNLVFIIADRLKKIFLTKHNKYWININLKDDTLRIEARHIKDNAFTIN